MNEWIKVKDRLPEIGQLVLIFIDRRECFLDKMLKLSECNYVWPQRTVVYSYLCPATLCKNKDARPYFLDEYNHSFDPDWWMPLPKPPRGSDE